jgi:hypothetical protein
MVLCAAIALTVCAIAVAEEPLPSGKARIIGESRVTLHLSSQEGKLLFVPALDVDPGDVTVLLRTSLTPVDGPVLDLASNRHIKSCSLKVEAGHIYLATLTNEAKFQAYWNRPIIITDMATNTVVATVVNAKATKE